MQYSIEIILMQLFKSYTSCMIIGMLFKVVLMGLAVYLINKKHQLLEGRKVVKCIALVVGIIISDYLALLIYNSSMQGMMSNRYNELFGWLLTSAIVMWGVHNVVDIIVTRGNNILKAAAVVILALTTYNAVSPVHHRILSACGAYDYMQNFLKVCGWFVLITLVTYGLRYIELVMKDKKETEIVAM